MTPAKKNYQLRIALIGCGRISQTHLQAISTLQDLCQLKAVSDVRESAAISVAEQYGCKAFADYRQVVDGDKIEAVIIASPPSTHAEIAMFFLEQGIHVLCEKPLAIRVADAEQMVKKASERDCRLMMASKYRYVDDVIKAKGIVESGILGDVMLFENVFCSKVDMRDRWNAQKQIAGGGVLVDNGCHSVDIARYLLGPIEKVQAEEGRRVQKLEVEDTARLYFRTKSDTMGAVDLSWSIHKEQESYVNLYGTEGVLSIGWKCSKYRQSEKMHWIPFGKGYDKNVAFSSQIKNFIGAIRGKEAPLITPNDGLESVRVIETAYRSMQTNKWIEVVKT